MELKSFKCKNCGAATEYSATHQSLRCDFCGSVYVTETPAAPTPAAGGVPGQPPAADTRQIVPFKIDNDRARQIFHEWIGASIWRPGDVVSMSAIEQMNGIYIPFWAYSVNVHTNWTGEYSQTHYRNVERTELENGREVRRTVSEPYLVWYPQSGVHDGQYRRWLVSASKGLGEEWVRKLVPFEFGEARPVSADYMAGWRAEQPTIGAEEGWGTAQRELTGEERAECARLIERLSTVNCLFGQPQIEQFLLPIWIAAYRYGDKPFRFFVNGQTGEIHGTAPVSALRVGLAITAGVLLLAALIWFASQGHGHVH